MGWSKNITEERESPEQVLLGAMDPNYCVLLALAIHLKHGVLNGDIDTAENHWKLLFGPTVQTAPN